jgi:hypothetical protein
LHTPEIRHRFGFLYASFNVGGEYWEIHEVFRKMILTGLLVFIPGSSRAAVAILVSVLSVASLNYVKPHKNNLVFWVAQGSFLVTTFKYLSVILLTSDMNTNKTLAQTQSIVGILLVVLDVTFMIISFFSLFAVILILSSVLAAEKRQENASATQVVPAGELGIGGVSSKWRVFDHKKAIEHAKVEQTEIETQRAHDAAMKVVEEHRAVAHMRLLGRIKKRNTIMKVNMVAINSVKMKKVVPPAPSRRDI